ncbi:MAG: DUF3810 domain-containing protein [Clostridia bacterium]|nr:DUF3810 domain-containing protein [Clostridia bacterium]
MKFKNPFSKKEEPVTEAEKLEATEEDIPVYHLSWFWRSLYIAAGVSLVIYILTIFFTPIADFFNFGIATAVRALLSYVTYLFPFSVAEILLLLLIPAIIVAMIHAFRKYCDTWHNVRVFVGKVGGIIMVIFCLFVFTLGTGYRTTELDVRLGIEDETVDAEGLLDTLNAAISDVNETVNEVEFGKDNFSVMPYSIDEMNVLLMEAYDRACDKYGFIPRLHSRVKPVMLSEPMSYTHITGVYTFFTGESNINVVFPDYTIPFTAAHELAHQRGFAREDEANFIAYLVCIESDDPYIRYSGQVRILEYLLDSHYSADTSENHEEYMEIYRTVDPRIQREQVAYYNFYQKYANNVVADISGAVNDTFLKSQGTEGTVSYGLVTELAVKYHKSLRD